MNNIVERLRVTHQVDTGNGYYETVCDPLRTEAADLIESLQARVKELEAENAQLSQDLAWRNDELNKKDKELAALRKRIEDAPVVAYVMLCDEAVESPMLSWNPEDWSARWVKVPLIRKEDLTK